MTKNLLLYKLFFVETAPWYKLFVMGCIITLMHACEKKVIPDPKLSILQNPANAIVSEGEIAVFKIEVAAAYPLTYQWYKDEKPIIGATSFTLRIPQVSINDNGAKFTVLVSNGENSIVSDPAFLTVRSQFIHFTTMGPTFSPLIEVEGSPEILWVWADSSNSNSQNPIKNYGSSGLRINKLKVTPWSALKTINIGYDGQDGGSDIITHVSDQHVLQVSGLENVAPYLKVWCSSYNSITSLDFSNFTNLHTIECFNSHTLESVNLTNTPLLRRVCFEDCNLKSLDLSQSPMIEDLRGAVNNYPSINFGNIGSSFRHICIRDNKQITNNTLFANTGQFPNLTELWIWNTNQKGALRIPNTHPKNWISVLCDDNQYTSIDLSGSLLNSDGLAEVSFNNNQISQIDISGCIQITRLLLANNKLSTSEIDKILNTLDKLGRDMYNTSAQYELKVDLSSNDLPGASGYASAQNLASKGWKVMVNGLTLEPGQPANIGQARIDFTTYGDSTAMRCDFIGTQSVTWYWSDGSSSHGTSGSDIIKSGLGSGHHSHYLLVSNGASLTRFGTSAGGGKGKLVSISDFINVPNLKVLYLYRESLLTSIGRSNSTKLKEYHLIQTGLSELDMDQVFEDAVLSGVINGMMFYNNLGTSGSDANKAILKSRGWKF